MRGAVVGPAALAGAVAAAGQEPVALPLLALAGVAAGLLLGATVEFPRRAAWLGWGFGAGYFAVTLHWIVEPFLVDIARHGWMAPFALVLLAGGLALFWAAAFWTAARLTPPAGLARVLALAGAVTLAEFARATLFTGFPWAMLGALWTASPVAMVAAWLGPHGLTLATCLAASAVALALRARRWLPGLAVVAVVAAAWVGGMALQARVGPPPADAPIVRIVQPNEAQHLKWRSDMIPVFWQRKLDLTAAPPGNDGARPSLVVWPEVTLPYTLGSRPDLTAQVARAGQGRPVIVGAQRFEGARLLNALAVVDPGGTATEVYDKHHLVPFGEYVPGGQLAAWVGLDGLATTGLGGFSPGPGPRLLDLRGIGLGQVLPLICYEAIFPRNARVEGTRPDWIVQITNDAWFGRFAGPQQHLAQARMRAIEQGLPLLRAANTGISAVIDPAGRILASMPLGEAGFLDVALPPPARPTPYARTGDAPALAVALLLLGVGWRGGRRNAD